MNPKIRVFDEGETEEHSPENYVLEAGGSDTTASRLFRDNAMYVEGELENYVEGGESVIERAREEDDVMVARVSVPFWFLDKDDEVAETFGDDDTVTGLVEDYSEDAWRIIASETNFGRGGVYYNYEWTFIPKSVSTVITAAGFSSVDEARQAADDARDAGRQKRHERDEAFEEADSWDEKLEAVEQ